MSALVCFRFIKHVSDPKTDLFFFFTVTVKGSFTFRGLSYYNCLSEEQTQEFKDCNNNLTEKVKTKTLMNKQQRTQLIVRRIM